MQRSKKIVFIGTQNETQSLLHFFSQENQTEVVSSMSFLETMTQRFVPNLAIFDGNSLMSLYEVRKIEAMAKVPALIVAPRLHSLESEEFLKIIFLPNVIICNSQLALENQFVLRLKSIMEGTSALLPAKKSQIVKRAVLLIEEIISQKISRTEIAQKLGVCGDYLSRIFHHEMGIPLWAYLQKMRLFRAKELISLSSRPIREIATECGFCDVAYFSNVFKKMFAITPTTIRNGKIDF